MCIKDVSNSKKHYHEPVFSPGSIRSISCTIFPRRIQVLITSNTALSILYTGAKILEKSYFQIANNKRYNVFEYSMLVQGLEQYVNDTVTVKACDFF